MDMCFYKYEVHYFNGDAHDISTEKGVTVAHSYANLMSILEEYYGEGIVYVSIEFITENPVLDTDELGNFFKEDII